MEIRYIIISLLITIVSLGTFNALIIPYLHEGCQVWNCTFIGKYDYPNCYNVTGYRNSKTLNCPPCQPISWIPKNGTCYNWYTNDGQCPFLKNVLMMMFLFPLLWLISL